MTGGGGGLCVVRLPTTPDEPMVALAERPGRAIQRSANHEIELAQLYGHVRQIGHALDIIRKQTEYLAASVHGATGDIV